MPPTLTLKQAWNVVALVYGERGGICTLLEEMDDRDLIDGRMHVEMEHVIRSVERDPMADLGYVWPLEHDGDKVDRPRRAFANEQAGFDEDLETPKLGPDEKPEDEPESEDL